MVKLSACGFRCDLCPVNVDNFDKYGHDELIRGFAKYYNKIIDIKEIKPCRGCFHAGDPTCNIKECFKKYEIDSCLKCPEFMCEQLAEKMDRIEKRIEEIIDTVSEREYEAFIRPFESRKNLALVLNDIESRSYD